MGIIYPSSFLRENQYCVGTVWILYMHKKGGNCKLFALDLYVHCYTTTSVHFTAAIKSSRSDIFLSGLTMLRSSHSITIPYSKNVPYSTYLTAYLLYQPYPTRSVKNNVSDVCTRITGNRLANWRGRVECWPRLDKHFTVAHFP